MVSATEPVSSGDHRRARRQRSLLGGKLSFGEGYFTVDCIVRDLSSTGARVKVPEGQMLPPRLYFLELRSGDIHEARVAWRRDREVGLEFTGQGSPANPEAGEYVVLKRLWTESRERPGL
jgi:hypothetical protein